MLGGHRERDREHLPRRFDVDVVADGDLNDPLGLAGRDSDGATGGLIVRRVRVAGVRIAVTAEDVFEGRGCVGCAAEANRQASRSSLRCGCGGGREECHPAHHRVEALRGSQAAAVTGRHRHGSASSGDAANCDDTALDRRRRGARVIRNGAERHRAAFGVPEVIGQPDPDAAADFEELHGDLADGLGWLIHGGEWRAAFGIRGGTVIGAGPGGDNAHEVLGSGRQVRNRILRDRAAYDALPGGTEGLASRPPLHFVAIGIVH